MERSTTSSQCTARTRGRQRLWPGCGQDTARGSHSASAEDANEATNDRRNDSKKPHTSLIPEHRNGHHGVTYTAAKKKKRMQNGQQAQRAAISVSTHAGNRCCREARTHNRAPQTHHNNLLANTKSNYARVQKMTTHRHDNSLPNTSDIYNNIHFITDGSPPSRSTSQSKAPCVGPVQNRKHPQLHPQLVGQQPPDPFHIDADRKQAASTCRCWFDNTPDSNPVPDRGASGCSCRLAATRS
jgi:hypothetical protein